MLEHLFEFIYFQSAWLTSLIAILLSIVLVAGLTKQSQARTIATVLLLTATIISAPFYPMQMVWFPINLIYPISLIILVIHQFKIASASWLMYALLIAHSFMVFIGLNLLCSLPNTWGSGAMPIGVFQLPNSILIIFYLGIEVDHKPMVATAHLVTGILALMMLLDMDLTEGMDELEKSLFEMGEDGGTGIVEQMNNAIVCASIFAGQGAVLLLGSVLNRKS